MTKLKFIVCLMVLLAITSCDENCDDFCPSGPLLSRLKINLTINEENPEVEVTLFRGRIERQDTVLEEVVSELVARYELDADGYYSATARYKKGNKEILAINGKKFSLTEDDCGCEKAQNYSMNLTLKD
ncbi:MAG: hypothetical protein RIA69_20710 [Cyclobacteriaceae bacterium]